MNRLENKMDNIEDNINKMYLQACRNGNFSDMKKLLIEKHADIHYEQDLCFIEACERGYLNIVQFLTTSKKLRQHINPQHYAQHGFNSACQHGHYDIVQFLSSSPLLSNKVDVSAYNNKALVKAAGSFYFYEKNNNYEKIMNYLLYSEELSIKANLYHNKNQIFKVALSDLLQIDDDKLLKYLIFRCDYYVNEETVEMIDDYLQRTPKLKQYVFDLLAKKELEVKLTNTLENVKIDHHRHKI